MNLFDYILIVIIGLCLFFAVRYIITQRKSGKCIGCSGCNGCSGCKKDKKCDK